MEVGESLPKSEECAAVVYPSTLDQQISSIDSHNQATTTTINSDPEGQNADGEGGNIREVDIYGARNDREEAGQNGEEDEDDNNDEEYSEEDGTASKPTVSQRSKNPPVPNIVSPLLSQNLEYTAEPRRSQALVDQRNLCYQSSLSHGQFPKRISQTDRISTVPGTSQPYFVYHSTPPIHSFYERIGTSQSQTSIPIEAYHTQQLSSESHSQPGYSSSNIQGQYYSDIVEAPKPTEPQVASSSKTSASKGTPPFTKSTSRKSSRTRDSNNASGSRVKKVQKRKSHYLDLVPNHHVSTTPHEIDPHPDESKPVHSGGLIHTSNAWRTENQYTKLDDSVYSAGSMVAAPSSGKHVLPYREQHEFPISSPMYRAADEVSTPVQHHKTHEFEQFLVKPNFEPPAWQEGYNAPNYQYSIVPSSPVYRLSPPNLQQQMRYIPTAPLDHQHPAQPVLYTPSGQYVSARSLGFGSQHPSVFRENKAQAQLNVVGNLRHITRGWTPQEIKIGRRLVLFERRQHGVEVDLTFKPLNPVEYQESMCAISCIRRGQSPDYYVTSVDCIALLELIFNQRFSVEEKNRIRRNLEVCKPITVSKSKPELESFFRQIMGFGSPRPRNIEKDVKVFLWENLESALRKIVSKYTASSVAQK